MRLRRSETRYAKKSAQFSAFDPQLGISCVMMVHGTITEHASAFFVFLVLFWARYAGTNQFTTSVERKLYHSFNCVQTTYSHQWKDVTFSLIKQWSCLLLYRIYFKVIWRTGGKACLLFLMTLFEGNFLGYVCVCVCVCINYCCSGSVCVFWQHILHGTLLLIKDSTFYGVCETVLTRKFEEKRKVLSHKGSL